MDGLVLLYVRLQATEGSMNDALQHQGFCGGSVCTSNIYIYHEAHQFRTLLPAHQTIPQILFQPQNTQHTQIMYTRETLFGFMFPKKSDAMILQLL